MLTKTTQPKVGYLYSVTISTDGEGKKSKVIGWFRRMSDAVAFAKGKGIYGHDGSVRAHSALRTQGTYWLLSREEPIELTSKTAIKRDYKGWDI